MQLKQFDIVLVNLNPTKGAEQKGENRPCIILQTNASEDYGKTTIIAPLSSNIEKIYPFEVLLNPSKTNNLKVSSKVKFEQVRVIDKQRIINKIGRAEEKDITKIDYALNVIFDLERNFR